MSWFSDLADAASDAYSANQTGAANQDLANALNNQAAATAAAANAANANKPNWLVIGGIAGAVLLVIVVMMGRK